VSGFTACGRIRRLLILAGGSRFLGPVGSWPAAVLAVGRRSSTVTAFHAGQLRRIERWHRRDIRGGVGPEKWGRNGPAGECGSTTVSGLPVGPVGRVVAWTSVRRSVVTEKIRRGIAARPGADRLSVSCGCWASLFAWCPRAGGDGGPTMCGRRFEFSVTFDGRRKLRAESAATDSRAIVVSGRERLDLFGAGCRRINTDGRRAGPRDFDWPENRRPRSWRVDRRGRHVRDPVFVRLDPWSRWSDPAPSLGPRSGGDPRCPVREKSAAQYKEKRAPARLSCYFFCPPGALGSRLWP